MAEAVEGDNKDHREEIVSDIVQLSESMCQKVSQLNSLVTYEEDVEDLVTRSKKLQKGKRTKEKRSGFQPRTRNSVQISCCLMKNNGTKYLKESPLHEVDLLKTDTYLEVVSKICCAVGVSRQDREDVVLLSSRGSIISKTGDSKKDTWTLGSYLNKRHMSPEKLTLGLGIDSTRSKSISKEQRSYGNKRQKISHELSDDLDDFVNTRESVKKREKLCASQDSSPDVTLVNPSTITHIHPDVSVIDTPISTLVASNEDSIEVFYSGKGNILPLTREEVWKSIEGAPGKMDQHSAFIPFDHDVIKVLYKPKGGENILVLGPSSDQGTVKPLIHSDSPIVFTSSQNPVITSPRKPVALVVIAAKHQQCLYRWSTAERKTGIFPNAPVIFADKPDLYRCTVKLNKESISCIMFDVQLKPGNAEESVVSQEIPHRNTCNKHPIETIIAATPSFCSLQFTTDELLVATDNFAHELGQGGFGKVFLADNLRTRGTRAAVKVLTHEGSEALLRMTPSKQIETEMATLMKFRHRNLVEIMGYCFSERLKALVYDYMPNGCLYKWIHHSSSFLTWNSKYSIAKDCLRGIAYLHAAEPPIIHQDIKSANVLLDENFTAKIADFGFSWELPHSISGRTMVTAPLIARTNGYFPPEIVTGKVSPLCDIYSYGVVLLEMYTALMPYDVERSDADLATYTEDQRNDQDLFKTLADTRDGALSIETSEVFRKVINQCLQRYSRRPTAKQALDMLCEK